MLNDFSSEVLGGVYEKDRNICMKKEVSLKGQLIMDLDYLILNQTCKATCKVIRYLVMPYKAKLTYQRYQICVWIYKTWISYEKSGERFLFDISGK